MVDAASKRLAAGVISRAGGLPRLDPREAANGGESRCRGRAPAAEDEAKHPCHALTVTRNGYRGQVTGHKRNIDDLQGEIQELFADLWQVPRFSGLRPGFRPQCDCYRRTTRPRCTSSSSSRGSPPTLEVVAAGQSVVISGKRERSTAPAARYLAMEIDYGRSNAASTLATRSTRRARPRPSTAGCSR